MPALSSEVGRLGPLPDLGNRSADPTHARIAHWLAQVISVGAVRAGDRLPVEGDFARALGVSRATLRQALSSLEARGVLNRRRGRGGGTFVAVPRIDCDLTGLVGFTEQIRRSDRRPGATVIVAQVIPAPADVASALGLAYGVEVYEVVRVRSANGEAVALERSYLPAQEFPGLLDHDLSGSLYALMSEVYDRAPHQAQEGLEPIVADQRVSALLGVPQGTPVMLVERTAFTVGGLAVEFARDCLRGDRVRITVRTALASQEPVSPPQ